MHIYIISSYVRMFCTGTDLHFFRQFVSYFTVHKVSCGFLCSDYGVFKCSGDTAQEDGIFHRRTGPGYEPPAPVYRWTTKELAGPA